MGAHQSDPDRPDRIARDSRLARAWAVAASAARRYPRHLAHSVAHSIQQGLRGTLGSHPIGVATGPRPASERLAATWLGHAAVLLNLDGLTVLTDPVFSERIGLKLGPWTLGLRRREPLPVHEMPPIDLILISHSHFDHLDRPTLRCLVDRQTRVITAANTKRLIPTGFGEVIELPWDRATNINGLRVAAMKPKHWGARTAWDRHRGYNSYVIEGPRAQVLFAGDTAYTDAFKGVRSELAIFGIGAYDPWIANHANPEQVWDMFRQMPGEFLLPIHHSTFELSDEPTHEPMSRLIRAAGDDAARIVGSSLASQWRM